MIKVYNACDVALYVVHHSYEKQTPITNLHLQKILYYIQAYFLTKFNRSCFKEEILHRQYGPVIKEVYDEFKCYGANDIPKDASYLKVSFDKKRNQIVTEKIQYDSNEFIPQDLKTMDIIIDNYIKLNPFQLMKKTHEEDLWINSKTNDVIKVKDIKKYYSIHEERLLGNEC